MYCTNGGFAAFTLFSETEKLFIFLSAQINSGFLLQWEGEKEREGGMLYHINLDLVIQQIFLVMLSLTGLSVGTMDGLSHYIWSIRDHIIQ